MRFILLIFLVFVSSSTAAQSYRCDDVIPPLPSIVWKGTAPKYGACPAVQLELTINPDRIGCQVAGKAIYAGGYGTSNREICGSMFRIQGKMTLAGKLKSSSDTDTFKGEFPNDSCGVDLQIDIEKCPRFVIELKQLD